MALVAPPRLDPMVLLMSDPDEVPTLTIPVIDTVGLSWTAAVAEMKSSV